MASTGESHGLFWDDDGGDRLYNANSMEYWLKKFFTSGVFNGDLQVRATSGMTLVVGSGYANVDGKVRFWNADFNVTLSPANSTYPRIDTVVITRDNVNRDIRCEVVTGAYSADAPQPTAPVRNSEIYQLVLAQIYVGIGATSVSQSDITDTRVDSDLCGYITGTVEELDFSAFTAQFERYFAEFKATHMANFSAWELAQKAAYNSWFDLVQQQQIQDKASWDAWYADLQEELHELPPESAEYLQIQIDEIKESGLSGSILKISTINSELEGKTVTVTGNYHNEERTGIFDENLECEIIGIKSVGNVNISSTDGIRTAEATLSIPYYGNYNVPIAFWAATINLHGDENLYGALVTIKNSNDETVGTVVLSAIDGTATFTATYADTYTFSVEYQGETISASLVVDEETTYEVSLSAGFNYKTWCREGGVDATQYSSLADVFADELAVHRLMTVHASADYLIDAVSDDITTIDDFCANDTAMKWIGLRDYVCDGLTAISGVKAKFLASDYWERYLKDHVPTMISNTAPYGTASISGSYQTNNAYKVFDGDDSTAYIGSNNNTVTDFSFTYHFTTPICVKKLKIRPNSQGSSAGQITAYTISGSNDGSNFTSIQNKSDINLPADTDNFDNVENDDFYTDIRLTITQRGEGAHFYPSISTIQFYGRSLNVSVPVMTSNTAPFGVASASTDDGTDKAYMAFDSNNSTFWHAQSYTTSGILEYQFSEKIFPKMVVMTNRTDASAPKNFTIEGYDDTDWDILDTIENTNNNSNAILTYVLTNISKIYTKLRLNIASSLRADNLDIAELQFYGLDYSEREFEPNSGKKWLYDHGLELEPISEAITDGGTITFGDDFVTIDRTVGANLSIATDSAIDLTNYNKLFAIVDTTKNSSVALIGCSSTRNSNISSMTANKVIASVGSDVKDCLDISAVDTSQYPIVNANNTGTFNLKELWLEQ